MGDYAISISFMLDNNFKSILLDAVSDTTVSANSTVTAHPIVTGDVVADHIYKEPISMSFSGAFSLNGSKALIVDENGMRLENVQLFFERLKDEGIRCEIVKISTKNGSAKFARRSNMVLTSIQWTESINLVNYTFSFTQVMVAEIDVQHIDISDPNLPEWSEPSTRSFSETLIDWEEVDKAVLKVCDETKLTEEGWINFLASFGTNTLIAHGIGLGVALVLTTTVCASIPVAGWIVGAVVIAGLFIYGFVKAIVDAVDQYNYAIKKFKQYNDAAKNEEEVKRFGKFMSDIHESVASLDELVSVYQFTGTGSQQCLLNVNGKYINFIVDKINVTEDPTYDIRLLTLDNVELCSTTITPIISFTDCNDQNVLYAVDNALIYLVCPSDDATDITNCYIVVTKLYPPDFSAAVTEIVKNAILR